MIHGKALAIVVAFDIYRECCAGNLDPNWKTNTVDFHRFRERLATQMLAYSPKNLNYPGDEKFRVHTQLAKKKRANASVAASVSSTYTTDSGVDKNKLEESLNTRLCGFLDELLEHEKTLVKIGGKKNTHLQCVCCGEQTYWRCERCPGKPPLHASPPDGRSNSCFLNYHNTASYGKWRADWALKSGRKKREWKYPDAFELHQNERQIKRLHQAPVRTPEAPSEDLGDAEGVTLRDANGAALAAVL